MAIQLRIQHTQGEQVIALSPRTLDDPLVVGRSEEADIVIPSPDISKRHCALFVHERKWMIQDTGSRLGTFVAGERVTQPRMLNVGDEITFGEAAVVMSVEPLSISPTATTAPIVPPPPPPPQAVEESSEESSYEESTEEDDDEASFDAAAVSTPTTHFYVPKKKHVSSVGIGVTIAIIVALVGVAIWAVMGVERKKEAGQTVVVEEPKPAEPKSIFDFPDQNKPAAKSVPTSPATSAPPPAPKSAVVRTPAQPSAEQLDPMVDGMQRPSPVTTAKDPDPVDTTPPPPPPPAPKNAQPAADAETLPVDNPLRASPDWQRVEVAHRTAPPAEAIWVFTSYLTEHPDTPFKSDLDSFTADAFDRLWWYRIKELTEQVPGLKKNLQKIDNDIRIETNAKMKKQFQADRKKIDADLQEKLTTLKEMNYESPEPPDVYDDAKLSELRPKRDPEYYEKWTKSRLSSIKYTRGRSAF